MHTSSIMSTAADCDTTWTPVQESSYASLHKITCTPVQESSYASVNNDIKCTPLQKSSQDDKEGHVVVTPWGDHYTS